MSKEDYLKNRPIFINELSDRDMEVRRQACATLLHTFPTSASRRSVMI